MPNGDIESARLLAVRGLLSTCELYTPTYVSDDTGGFTTTYVAGATHPCLVSEVKTSRSGVPTRVPEDAQFIVKLPHGIAISVGQRITTGDGHNYHVIAVGLREGGLYTLAYVGGPDV